MWQTSGRRFFRAARRAERAYHSHHTCMVRRPGGNSSSYASFSATPSNVGCSGLNGSMPGTAADFVESLGDVLTGLGQPDDDLASILTRPSGEVVAAFLQHRQVEDVLTWAARAEPGTPWGLRTAIEEALDEDAPLRAAPAVLGLTLAVLALSERLGNNQDDHGFAAIGDRRRISLLHFKTWWARRANVPLREVLVDFLEELVLQQHVAIAVARFDNEQRRLRFSNDEGGWIPLPGSVPAIPRLTPDRIGALLRLMADLVLVDEADDLFLITDAGRRVLDQVGERIVSESAQEAR